MGDINKHDDIRRQSLRDTDIMDGKTGLTHEEKVKLTELTEEELVIEKKLKRRIDFTIMPLVVLVSSFSFPVVSNPSG